MALKKKTFLLLVNLFIVFTSLLHSQSNQDWLLNEHQAQYVKAIELMNNKQYEKSLIISRKLLQDAISKEDNKACGYAYNAIAANFDAIADPEKALFYYKKALVYAKKVNDEKLLNWVYNNLGNIYCFNKNDYPQGINYYVKSLKFSSKSKDTTQIVFTKLNITWAYFDIKDFKNGAPYLKYINKYHSKYGDSSTITALNLLNGIYASHKNKSFAARKYFEQAIIDGIEQNENTDLSYTYLEYSKFLIKNGYTDLAYSNLIKYDSLNEKNKKEESLNNANITGINLEIDQYKRELDRIESLYKNKEELLQFEKSRNQRIIGIMISLFIIGIILFYFFFQNTRLKQKNKLKDVQRKIQDNLINASIDGQERERIEIAGFLHDNISAMLSSAGMHLKTYSSIHKNLPEEIVKTTAILEEAHDRVRDLSHELLPTLLVRFGLFYAIEDL